MDTKKRNNEFDIAKAMGIFLVILGHMPSMVPKSIRIWIFSFHMPLFYFIAGYFARDIKNGLELRQFIKRKWKGLIIPYIIYSCLFLFLDIVSGRVGSNQIISEIESILLGAQGVQWFLYGLFVVSLLFAIARLIKPKKIRGCFVIGCILLGCMLHFWGIENRFQLASSLYGVGFYYLGFLKRDKVQYDMKKALIFLIVSVVGVGILSRQYSVGILDMKVNAHIDILMNYLLALCSIYVILYISHIIKSSNFASIFLKYIGKNSLYFFALTWYIPGILGDIFPKQSFVLKIENYIVAFLFSWLCVEFKNKFEHVRDRKKLK